MEGTFKSINIDKKLIEGIDQFSDNEKRSFSSMASILLNGGLNQNSSKVEVNRGEE